MRNKRSHIYYYLYEVHVINKESKLYDTYYYGKHETDNLNDNYYGSGTLIRRYIDKYGISGLEKCIIAFYSSREELNEAEKYLIESKRQLLGKNKCQNMHEGGGGGHWVEYIDEEEYKDRCRKVRDGFLANTTEEQRRNNSKKAGEAKKYVSAERKEEWRKHYREAYKNMSPEKKKMKYDKVSKSLKNWYQKDSNKKAIIEKNRKNKETNKRVSKQWRDQFRLMFGCNAEQFRKYGKMKAALILFNALKGKSDEVIKDETKRFVANINK